MAWRIIGIENPARLSTRDNQLVIRQNVDVSLPIEDIDSLILDSYGILATAQLLTELSSRGTTVVICDDKHLPASVLLPYSQHSRQAKVTRAQLAMRRPLEKQLWKQIIQQKIINQAQVLTELGYDDEPLTLYASQLKSGDSTNRESLAARVYFSQLLDDATRRKPIWYNAALNYGYAIVRSHIARHIAARGLVCAKGIFHRSELNSYNLADDLIEPFRPLVDEYILGQVALYEVGDRDSTLTTQDRRTILDVMNSKVSIGTKNYTMKFAAGKTVESFVSCIHDLDSNQIQLPKRCVK